MNANSGSYAPQDIDALVARHPPHVQPRTVDSAVPAPEGDMVRMVAFKWLMAGVGWRVDLSRLQRDSAYAAQCARWALSSRSDVLRRDVCRMLRHLPQDAGECAAHSAL